MKLYHLNSSNEIGLSQFILRIRNSGYLSVNRANSRNLMSGCGLNILLHGPVIEILIKFLESRMTVFVHTRMSSKLPSQKMADTSKDELLLGRGIRHVTVRRCITRTL